MNKVDRYLAYMKFKSYFKNIPILSSLIRYVKWKYYRPVKISMWTKGRKKDYNLKEAGKKKWTENEKKLWSLKDSHKGESAFIIGNGPSLKPEYLKILKDNGVFCFAMNRINLIFDKTEWRPDCYMAIDRLIYRENDPTIPTVLAENLPLYIVAEDVYDGFDEAMKKENVLYFYSQENSYYKQVDEFSENPVKYLVDGFTVAYSALQMAYWMGFSNVYLLGIDCNYGQIKKRDGSIVKTDNQTTYFDKRYDPKNKNMGFVIGMFEAFMTAKRISIDKNFHIYNVSIDSKLDMFPKIDFMNLFN